MERVAQGGTTVDAREASTRGILVGGRMYLLVRQGADLRIVEVFDGDEITIGRSETSRIFAEDSRLSRHHARVRRAGSSLWLDDLGSRNGTRVNGELVRSGQKLLDGGDVIQAGPIEIVAAVVSAAGPAPSADDDDEAGPAGQVIIADDAMVKVFQVVRRLAQVQTTVLIWGETGVGKEVIAEQIHRSGPRAAGPFVRLNCASLPDSLLESELFGHEKGAFTGADKRKTGYLEAATGGTLLLDEIGEIPLSMQVKLLRALESRRISRVGGTQEIALDARVLCATHRDLQAEIAAGRFRQDFYYRVAAFVLEVPPLRERPTEIGLLAARFASDLGATGSPVFTKEALSALAAYPWPGNIRELRNAVEHAAVLADCRPIRPEHLPQAVLRGKSAQGAPRAVEPPSSSPDGAQGPMREQLASVERKSIEDALAAESGNQTRAARRLGISRRALIYKLAKYGIER